MSVFKLPEPSPTLPRNGFDLSSRRIFSAPAGALLPVLTQECNPGDHFRINVQDFVRTQPLNTAAFARCKEYYHFFFVPYRALWSSSDRFFTGVSNGDKSFLSPDALDKGLGDFGGQTVDFSSSPRTVPCFDLFKVIQMLGDGAKTRATGTGKYLLSGGAASKSSKVFGKQAYEVDNDIFGYPYKAGAYRLLNLMEFGVRSGGLFFDPKTKTYVPKPLAEFPYKLSAFRPLAYQRIYNDFYRNDQWEKSDPTCFNVDYLYNGGDIPPTVAFKMFQLRYRYWSKDWLTSALPSINYSDGIFNLPTFNNSTSVGISGNDISTNIAIDSSVTDSLGNYGITVADIKAAFALDKMLEATRRANGLDYSSQIAAHFGFKVKETRRDCAQFIGGFDNAIAISEVVTTSNGSVDGTSATGSVTGQIFGKGVGSMQSNSIEYDVKEHGLIMCIYSIAPQVDYNSDYISVFNRKLSREDYFQPEFMNLGLQPILQSDLAFTIDNDVNNAVLGYTSRYAEYKTSRDLVFGEFASDGTLSAWTTPRKGTYTYKAAAGQQKATSYLSLSNFQVDPNVLKPIFSVAYDGTPKTDQFMINSYFDIKAVRSMSVVGSTNL